MRLEPAASFSDIGDDLQCRSRLNWRD